MSFAMLSDTVDYGEYKNGIRASGFLTAVGSVAGLQVGTGLGDFIPLKLLQYFGYIPNQEKNILDTLEERRKKIAELKA